MLKSNNNMTKKNYSILLLTVLAVFASTTQAARLKESLQKCSDSVDYSYSGPSGSDLTNYIPTYGGNVVVINLDDKCQLQHYLDFGVFIQTGDYIIVTGRQKPAAW